MILVDSSIWIDHLRAVDEGLAALLRHRQVLVHPYVIGEVALGIIRPRDAMLASLRQLPSAAVARDAEVLSLIERYRLFGRGIGYIDAHLLAAVRLNADTSLWTRDRRLADAAAELGVGFRLPA